MEQIYNDQFDKILPLFDFDFPNRTMLLAFAQGQTPGIAFVDNLTTPTACIVTIGFHNWTFVGGKPEQDWLNQAFAQLRRDKSLELAWATWADRGFTPPLNLTKAIKRYEFLDLPAAFNQHERTPQLPQDHYFRKMDQELFMRCLWSSEMIMAYGTSENFLMHAFGFCLMYDDEICCESYASFRAADRYEIGVITPEAYRRRGYAHMTCAYLAKKCAQSGYQTIWSCDQENVASVATARKLGYQIQREYQILLYAQNS